MRNVSNRPEAVARTSSHGYVCLDGDSYVQAYPLLSRLLLRMFINLLAVFTMVVMPLASFADDIFDRMTRETSGWSKDFSSYEKSRTVIQEMADANPNDSLTARVLIDRGATAKEVEDLVRTHSLEITGAVFKAPHTNGKVLTLGFGFASPELLQCVEGQLGPFDVQVLFEAAKSQVDTHTMLGESTEGPGTTDFAFDSDKLRAFLLYVIATPTDLLAAASRAEVLSVAQHTELGSISDYRELLRTLGGMCGH